MARPKKGQPSKTSFVLSQPGDLSAAEVVAKAKAAGITMSPAYVHTIRSAAKRRKGKAKGKPGRPKGSKNKSSGPSVAGSLKAAERQVLEWVLEHGSTAVQRMVETVTERIRKIAG